MSIPGIHDEERARKLVEDQAFLEFKITDKTRALERALPKLDQAVKQRGLATTKALGDTSQAAALSPAAKGLQGLLTAGDTSKKTDSSKKVASATNAKDTANADSLKVQPGGAFSSLLQQGQMPGEYYVDNNQASTLESYIEDSVVAAAIPPGKELLPSTDSVTLQGKTYRAFYVVDSKSIMTGDHLKGAQPNNNTMDGTVVEFELDNVGGRTFRTQTGNHVGDYMAIILDGRVMGRPPVIQSAIGTRGQITMGGKDPRCRAGSRARAPRRRASRSAACRAVAEDRSEPRPGLDRQGRNAVDHRRRAGRHHHDGLLPLLRVARGRRSGALHALHARGARRLRCGPHAAGYRRLRAVDRYRGRCERADLRAHP